MTRDTLAVVITTVKLRQPGIPKDAVAEVQPELRRWLAVSLRYNRTSRRL